MASHSKGLLRVGQFVRAQFTVQKSLPQICQAIMSVPVRRMLGFHQFCVYKLVKAFLNISLTHSEIISDNSLRRRVPRAGIKMQEQHQVGRFQPVRFSSHVLPSSGQRFNYSPATAMSVISSIYGLRSLGVDLLSGGRMVGTDTVRSWRHGAPRKTNSARVLARTPRGRVGCKPMHDRTSNSDPTGDKSSGEESTHDSPIGHAGLGPGHTVPLGNPLVVSGP